MGLFRNPHEGMQWFEDMTQEEKIAYLKKKKPNTVLIFSVEPSSTNQNKEK